MLQAAADPRRQRCRAATGGQVMASRLLGDKAAGIRQTAAVLAGRLGALAARPALAQPSGSVTRGAGMVKQPSSHFTNSSLTCPDTGHFRRCHCIELHQLRLFILCLSARLVLCHALNCDFEQT